MEIVGKIIGFIMLAIALSILMAWPVQYLWNLCLVPAIEGVNPIGVWQALGLSLLFSVLFKPNSTTSD